MYWVQMTGWVEGSRPPRVLTTSKRVSIEQRIESRVTLVHRDGGDEEEWAMETTEGWPGRWRKTRRVSVGFGSQKEEMTNLVKYCWWAEQDEDQALTIYLATRESWRSLVSLNKSSFLEMGEACWGAFQCKWEEGNWKHWLHTVLSRSFTAKERMQELGVKMRSRSCAGGTGKWNFLRTRAMAKSVTAVKSCIFCSEFLQQNRKIVSYTFFSSSFKLCPLPNDIV